MYHCIDVKHRPDLGWYGVAQLGQTPFGVDYLSRRARTLIGAVGNMKMRATMDPATLATLDQIRTAKATAQREALAVVSRDPLTRRSAEDALRNPQAASVGTGGLDSQPDVQEGGGRFLLPLLAVGAALFMMK